MFKVYNQLHRIQTHSTASEPRQDCCVVQPGWRLSRSLAYEVCSGSRVNIGLWPPSRRPHHLHLLRHDRSRSEWNQAASIHLQMNSGLFQSPMAPSPALLFTLISTFSLLPATHPILLRLLVLFCPLPPLSRPLSSFVSHPHTLTTLCPLGLC